MRLRLRLLTLLVCGLTLPGTAAAQAYTLRDLLIKVPEDCNSIVVMYVPSLHRSAIGRAEGWAKKHEAAFTAGKVPFPPQTIMMVLAGHASTDPNRQHGYEVGMISMSKSMSFDKIVSYEQGIVEEVAGTKTILTPRHVYITPLSQRLVTVQRPAERQHLSRWLQFAKRNKNPVMNDWLLAAANELDKTGQVIAAVYLEDAVDTRHVRQRLGALQPPLPGTINLDALAEALASVRGLRLAIQVKEDIQGEVRIEFNKPVKAFAEVLQPVLAKGMANLGEGLPDVSAWKMEVEDQAVTFRSPLTTEAFAALLSALAPQAAPAGLGADETALGGDKAFASRRYFQQVTNLVDELNKVMVKQTDYNVAAQSCEDFAQRIERVPVYGADEELVTYATGLTGKLRTVAESLQGVPITATILEASKKETFLYQPPSYTNTGDWYGRGRRGPRGRHWGGGGGGGTFNREQAYYDSNIPELRGKLAEAILKDQQSRDHIWKTIEADTKRIREKMGQKYGEGF
jgi:hypothetical protein